MGSPPARGLRAQVRPRHLAQELPQGVHIARLSVDIANEEAWSVDLGAPLLENGVHEARGTTRGAAANMTARPPVYDVDGQGLVETGGDEEALHPGKRPGL